MDHVSEIARPDYYSVTLPDECLEAEMAGLSRSGIFRFTYGNDGIGHIVVNPNSDEGEGSIELDLEKREIRGRNPRSTGYIRDGVSRQDFSGWFVVRLPQDLEIVDAGTFRNDTIYPGNDSETSRTGIGAYVSFRACKGIPVVVKAGSSFTSLKAAAAAIWMPKWRNWISTGARTVCGIVERKVRTNQSRGRGSG